MPTYEYQCAKCGHEFERDQRITDGPVKKCPSCKAARVKRLISTTSFVLKGGGWYSDLYSSGKSKSDAGDSADSVDSGETKAKTDSTTTETTPKPTSGGDDKPASGKSGKGGKKKSSKTAA